MSEKFWYLKNCDLFTHLEPDELRQLESRSRFRQLPRNTPIYLPVEEATGVLLLVSGRVKICHTTSEGKQCILTFIEPGELFGELAIFQGGNRDEYAESVAPSALVLIPVEEIQRLMEQHADITLGITRLIGLRRRRIELRLKYLLFHSNYERLVSLLLELAEQYGQPSGDGVDLGIKLSHQDLASIIGSTRETVTTTLGELQGKGLLRVGRRQLMLLDIRRLAESINVSAPVIAARPVPPPHRELSDNVVRFTNGSQQIEET